MKILKVLTQMIVVLYAASIIAQPATDKAKEILSVVSQKTKAYKTMAVEFSYTAENSSSKTKDSKDGKLFIKGEKYKLEMAKQIVYSDGKTVWTYLSDANEVQINNVSTKDDAVNPSTIFTLWEKGFKSKYIKEETQKGVLVDIIDLTPLKGKSYYKVRLIIDKTKKQIVSATVYEKNNNTYSYIVKKFTTNTTIEDSQFAFDKSKYPGVEIIDMR